MDEGCEQILWIMPKQTSHSTESSANRTQRSHVRFYYFFFCGTQDVNLAADGAVLVFFLRFNKCCSYLFNCILSKSGLLKSGYKTEFQWVCDQISYFLSTLSFL